MVLAVHSRVKDSHQFPRGKCGLCHINVNEDARVLFPLDSRACKTCHKSSEETQSHPVDISPAASIPPDLPLVEGKLSCVTCHFVHLSSVNYKGSDNSLLRRPS